MELKKLLKVPRSARTVAITIVVPESVQPASPSDPKAYKPTGWARVWAVLKIAGPTAGSIVAIVISVLALVEQKSVDQYQQQTNQRAEASLVSFVPKLRRDGASGKSWYKHYLLPYLIVNISGFFPPSNGKSQGHLGATEIQLELNNIPACSSATVDIDQEAELFVKTVKGLVDNTVSFPEMTTAIISADQMTFTDGNGLSWEYFNGGCLQQLASPQSGLNEGIRVASTYQTANGCA